MSTCDSLKGKSIVNLDQFHLLLSTEIVPPKRLTSFAVIASPVVKSIEERR